MGDHDRLVEHQLDMIEKAAAFGATAELETEVKRELLRKQRAKKSSADTRKKKFKLNLGLFDNACTSACDEADAWRQARLEAARAEKQKQERMQLQEMAKSGELNREVGQRSADVLRAPLGSGQGPKSPKRLLREAHQRTVAIVSATEKHRRRYCEFGELLESIESGAIAALRGSYVVELSECGGKLRRRQELPAEAFFPIERLRELLEVLPAEAHGLLFVALSYRWLTPSEPDPSSFHLSVVADVARLYLGRSGHALLFAREKSPLAAAFDAAGLGAEAADFALFWDLASLCQPGDGGAPRSAEDDALFAAGRKASATWYAHERTVVWQQKAVPVNFRTLPDLRTAYTYGQSGWTFFESALASSLKLHPTRRLDIGRAVPQGEASAESKAALEAVHHAYGGRGPGVEACCLERVCVATERFPLMLPEEMARLLQSEKRYRPSGPYGDSGEGWEAEAALLSELYAEFFHSVAHTQTQLMRRRVGWGDAEMSMLARSLPSFVVLQEIDLQGNTAVRKPETWRALGEAIVTLSEAPPPHDALVAVTLDGGFALPIKLLRGKIPEPERTSSPYGGGFAGVSKALGGSVKAAALFGKSLSGSPSRSASPTGGLGQPNNVGRLAAAAAGGLEESNLGGAIAGALLGKSKAAKEQDAQAARMAELVRRRKAERIDLSDRQLGVASAIVLAACLDGIYPSMAPNKTITELDCRHNKEITGEAAEQLAHAVLARPQLVTFSRIPLDKLREDSAKARNPIKELELFDSGLGPAEGHVLGSLLDAAGGSLLSLNLAYNHLGADGATAIANALYRNDVLTKLNLEQNGLGEKGGCAIAGALRVNATLTSLDLSRNDIGDATAKDLAESCRDSRSLHVLNLSGSCRSESTNLGPGGARALASAVAESHSLSRLTLSNNPIGEEGARALAKAVEHHGAGKPSSLTSLNVRHTQSGHGLSREETAHLKKAVKTRPNFDLAYGHMVGF